MNGQCRQCDELAMAFRTKDPIFAAYLESKGIRVIRIEPGDDGYCAMVLEEPTERLIHEWVAGDAQAPARRVIDAYRRLTRELAQVKRQGKAVER